MIPRHLSHDSCREVQPTKATKLSEDGIPELDEQESKSNQILTQNMARGHTNNDRLEKKHNMMLV
jgi:hypothetical protein